MVVLQPENTYNYSVLKQQACNEFQNDTIHPEKNASNLP